MIANGPVPEARPVKPVEGLAVDSGLGSDAGSLYLRSGIVDLRSKPSLLKSGIVFDAGRHYVIQLNGPITPTKRALLNARGVELGDYLPMYAYVATLGGVDAQSLLDLGFVAWIGPYEDAWKICPNIGVRMSFTTSDRRRLEAAGKKRLVVSLFTDARLASAKRRIEQVGGSTRTATMGEGRRLIEVDLPHGRLESLRTDPDVMFIEEASEAGPRNSTTTWILQSNVDGVVPLWNAGLHGEDQIVGIIDWGLDADHCAFDDTIPIGPDHRKLRAYHGFASSSPNSHGTHVGGILAGDELADTNPDLKGMAYESRIVFQHYPAVITSSNLEARLVIAHDDGARIHSNSWGSNDDNSYNAWARDIDLFSRNNEEDLVVFAIINGGATSPVGSILNPENAKNCLAVGSCGDTPIQGYHGSGGQGPTTDGRQKPEVWTPGCGTTSATVNTPCNSSTRGCATSYAAPSASGMAILARQYFTDGFYPSGASVPEDSLAPSGALLKAILINSAVNMEGFPGYFGTFEGWGRILMDDALYFADDARKLVIEDVRNDDGLNTGEMDTYFIAVTSADEPLKITLVWTDVPATIGTAYAPVNNIDLSVTDPDGIVYLGNVFDDTQSQTGGTADPLNNAEQVHRSAPVPGTWQIDVLGTDVNQGIQGYALVVTGDAPLCLGADLDHDLDVDGSDYAIFLAAFTAASGDPRYNAQADYDDDGVVSLVDYQTWLAFYRDCIGNGVAPPPIPPARGDMNVDGTVDGRDIQGFIDVITNPTGAGILQRVLADMNEDGLLDDADIEPFIDRLLNPGP